MNKHLLTDCDNVLLKSMQTVTEYLESLNIHVSEEEKTSTTPENYSCFQSQDEVIRAFENFQRSKLFAKIPALPKAVENVHKLKSLGYKISIITAAGHLDIAKEHRNINLNQIFGSNVFDEIIYVDWTEDKNKILQRFAPTYFIEDSVKNAIRARSTHHQPILLRHPQTKAEIMQNKDQLSGVPIVDNWNEISDIILNKS